MRNKSILRAMILPICACALTACGGGGGGGNNNNNNNGGGGVSTPDSATWDNADWSGHPGADVSADVSTVTGEPLAGKKLVVTRPGNGDGSDTTLTYSFLPGCTGTYTQVTSTGAEQGAITGYTYTPSTKQAAVLSVNINTATASKHHQYNITFSSAKKATGTLTIGDNTLGDLSLEFGK